MPYRKSDRVVERKVRGERMLVPIPDSEEALDSIYVLNETAALIWDRITEGATVEQVAAGLETEYEVSAQTAVADVQAVVDDLLEFHALIPHTEHHN